MAVKWSWAFGNESALQLNNEMGFNINTTDAFFAKPISDAAGVYTYPGSPTRYSLDTGKDYRLETPSSAWTPAGWIAAPIRTFQGWESDASSPVMQAYGNNQTIYIWCDNEGASTLKLSFYSVTGYSTSHHSIPGSFPDGDWRYFALKYDTTITQPNAEVWVDGTLVLAVTASWTGVANTSGYYKFGGYGNGSTPASLNAPLAQIIIYDTGSLSSGNPYDPVYCTRLNPTADTATSGTWTPSVGSDDYAVLSSSFDSSTHTVNTGASGGEFVTCQASIDIATQIGTSPGMISGITLHAWASGSGLNGKAALSNNDMQYDYGDVITPDINDPTYCFFTAPKQVQVLAQDWEGVDMPYMRYELTGS